MADEEIKHAGSPAAVMLDYAAPPLPLAQRMWRKMANGRFALGVLSLAIVIMLAASLLPVLATGEPGSPRTHCLSNLRNIGIALAQYAASNGGVYPQRLADICSVGVPPSVLVCPASKTQKTAAVGATPQQTINNILAGGNHVSYIYLVGGRKTSSVSAWSVVAYEPMGNHGSMTKGSVNVLYGDGHAASLPIAQAARMISQLSAGQNPPPAAKGN